MLVPSAMKRRVTSEEYRQVLGLLDRLSRPELASVRASCASRLRRNHAGGRPAKPEASKPEASEQPDVPWEC